MTENSIKALADIAANPPNSDRFIAWANLMLVEGHDSYHLRILAGMDNATSFETELAFRQALKELNRWPFDAQAAMNAYRDQLLQGLATGVTVPYRLTDGGVTVASELWVLYREFHALPWAVYAFESAEWPPHGFSDPARLADMVRDTCQEVKEEAAALLSVVSASGHTGKAADG